MYNKCIVDLLFYPISSCYSSSMAPPRHPRACQVLGGRTADALFVIWLALCTVAALVSFNLVGFGPFFIAFEGLRWVFHGFFHAFQSFLGYLCMSFGVFFF